MSVGVPLGLVSVGRVMVVAGPAWADLRARPPVRNKVPVPEPPKKP